MIDFIIIICLNYKTMITDADIKKMKSVFVTKDDLKAFATKEDFVVIQGMFDSSRKETNERFQTMNERFDKMDKKFEGKFDKLSDQLQQNAEDLIELITAGFNSYEVRIGQIEEEVFKTN